MTSQSISVITLNLANYDDHANWPQRIEIITNIILENKEPEIILLQETRMNPDQQTTSISYQDMAQQVLFALQKQGRYLKAQVINAPVAYYPFNSFTVPVPSAISPTHQMAEWEGVSVISNLFILETGTLSLSPPEKTTGDLNPRITQFLSVDLTNGSSTPRPMYFFNTHFSYDQSAELEALKTVAYMKRIASPGSYFLMAGDLNSTPDSPCVKILNQSDIVQDLWPYIWGNNRGYTYPSTLPTKRIDYFFTSNNLTNLCKSCVLIGTNPVSGIFASDHYGLCATFEIPKIF